MRGGKDLGVELNLQSLPIRYKCVIKMRPYIRAKYSGYKLEDISKGTIKRINISKKDKNKKSKQKSHKQQKINMSKKILIKNNRQKLKKKIRNNNLNYNPNRLMEKHYKSKICKNK
jgi:hypothetical protein